MYEIFEHTADVGIRARGDTLGALCREAARGLYSLLIENPEAVRPAAQRSVRVGGSDPALLLFDWLSELLYLFETEHFLGARFEVSIAGGELRGVVAGETLDTARHGPGVEVKAVTYHRLCVAGGENGWEASVVVDV